MKPYANDDTTENYALTSSYISVHIVAVVLVTTHDQRRDLVAGENSEEYSV